MHARKTARDAIFPSAEDDVFFAPRRGDIVFRDNLAARVFAERVNRAEKRAARRLPQLTAAEVTAMSVVHEVLHAVVGRYQRVYPTAFARLRAAVDAALGPDGRWLASEFLGAFPPPMLYRALRRKDVSALALEELTPTANEVDQELLLLWVMSENPAYDTIRTIAGDQDLGTGYRAFVVEARRFFDREPRFGPRDETLVDLLLAPGRAHPTSIFAQLEFIERSWGEALQLTDLPVWDKIPQVQDLKAEEKQYFEKKDAPPGPGEPLLESMRFQKSDRDEPANFSPDLNWMPNVVLLAKSVYVWLDQLSKKYGRDIHRLDQIPDEELDLLAARKLNGLWLIGLFERSRASRKVKQMRGDAEALASAYSLAAYDIARELGGVAAYENLKARAWRRGIRLAADMVPNHVGVDGDWVMEHPDWFLQAKEPPFPNYRFGGPDLSDDPRAAISLEEGYWSMTDAAVVFRRRDRHTGEDRFIYHGNDGTSMPWNDTAQLDYLKPEVRRAVIETILHVARMFPIIRFDAAMTLAKRHVQRLWYPLKGQAEASIPSRADYALTQEEFDARIPVEFWREVVDTVAERAPDTLLLAEAFWMMEGYFVRTLGMHRVYNSAFMNMLKREENEKYRETIKNVLDFDPEILKRFVNFMNNPDEETAVAQFGMDDRYFGVCTLMCTMPGLPMFGHGQIEGLREKYGMEYRRPRWSEQPNEALVRRHEEEIFPILEKRHLFSGVEHFALYDFMVGGLVDEDVYAYSNGAGAERALVLFNNRFKNTRGRILASTHRGSLASELGLDEDLGWWLVIRDIPHGLEYLRPTKDIVDGGMAWELLAFQYHVLSGFKHVNATLEKPYDRLALELDGRGVPDVEAAVFELYRRPVHAPLRSACSKGHIGYLAAELDADSPDPASVALEQHLSYLADGLDWMLSQRAKRDVAVDRTALQHASEIYRALHAFVRASRPISERDVAPPESPPKPTLREAPRSATALGDSSAVLPEIAPSSPAVAPSTLGAGAAEPSVTPVTAVTPGTPPKVEPASFDEPSTEDVDDRLAAKTASVLHVDLLLAWIQVEAAMELLAGADAALEEARSRPPQYLSTMRFTSPDPSAPVVAEVPDSSAIGVSTPPSLAALASPSRPVIPAPSVSSVLPVSPARDESSPAPISTDSPPVSSSPNLPAMTRSGKPAPPPKSSKVVISEAGVSQINAVVTQTASSPAPLPSASQVSLAGLESAPSLPSAIHPPPSAATLDLAWRVREALLEEWSLATPLREGFETNVDAEEAKRRTALVLLAATLPRGSVVAALRLAIGSPRGQVFMNVHQADGTWWLSKERFEELARFVEEREIALGNTVDETKNAAALAKLAEDEGYRAENIARRLGPLPRIDPA